MEDIFRCNGCMTIVGAVPVLSVDPSKEHSRALVLHIIGTTQKTKFKSAPSTAAFSLDIYSVVPLIKAKPRFIDTISSPQILIGVFNLRGYATRSYTTVLYSIYRTILPAQRIGIFRVPTLWKHCIRQLFFSLRFVPQIDRNAITPQSTKSDQIEVRALEAKTDFYYPYEPFIEQPSGIPSTQQQFITR